MHRTTSPAHRGLCRVLILLILGTCFYPGEVLASKFWFSGPVDPAPTRKSLMVRGDLFTAAAGSSQLFDVTVSLHDNPTGDDNGNTQGSDPASVDQDKIERILQHFADGVYESTEGAHKIRTIRIFRDKKRHDKADIKWEPADRPYADLNGIGRPGSHIYMFDNFGGHLMRNDEIGAGYTLAHEWGHYAYGLKDEYSKQTGDVPVVPSMMNSQWKARNEATGTLVDTDWLNFSIAFQSDPPGPFQNTKKNLQHRRYGASAWEVLSRKPSLLDRLKGLLSIELLRVFYPTLASAAPTGTNTPHSPDLPGSARSDLDIIWMKNDLTYEIVIDNSGSMAGSKINNAKTAAQLLVDLALEGSTRIGVIAFNSTPSTVVPITPITNAASKNAVKSAIGGISAGGGTSIGAAAQAALNTLLASGTTNDTKIVFLLSDGLSGDDALAPVPAFVANQVPILTFSYGGDADTATLGQMAAATKGKLFISPISLAQVSQAFQAANAFAASQASVASGSRSIAPGEQSSIPILVDSTMGTLVLAVSHTGAPSSTSFVLVGPDGTSHSPSTTSASGGETLNLFEVESPVQGNWSLQVTTSTATSFHYQVSANPNGDSYSLAAESLLGETLHYPAPLVLRASLGKQRPIAGATVTAVIVAPDGTTRTVPLLDDGVTPDEHADDGRYGAVVTYDQSGVYDVTVRAEAVARTAMFTSTGLELSIGPDGTPIPPAPDQPVSEAFQRLDRFQITVEGAAPDDHGNTPANATALSGMNDDLTPGRIERGGDVDVFSFTVPAGATEVAVRVTDLALTMSPRLRILGSDGVSVLKEGTFATSKSEGGYLALSVIAAPGTTLFAEVRHKDSQGGTGLYQVVAGPVIDLDQLVPNSLPDVKGSLRVAGAFSPGGNVTYTLTLTNEGAGAQSDLPGDEFVDVLPQGLELLSASASSGAAVTDSVPHTVTWNGSIPPSGTVTVTIQARILPGTLGRTLVNQGEIAFNGDGLGVNWSERFTDDPDAPGAQDPTTFIVGQQSAEIPTMSEVGFVTLCLLLAIVGLAYLRRKRMTT